MIGWGGPVSPVAFTEINSQLKITTEVSFEGDQTSYRVHKFEWVPPFLESIQ